MIAKRLIRYVKPYLPRFIEAGICMIGVALLTTGLVWIIRTVVDEVLIAKDMQKLFLIAIALPLVYAIKGVLSYIQNYLMNFISQSIVRDIRLELFTHIQRLSLDYFHRNATGHIMSRVTNDTTTLQNSIGYVPVQLIRDGLTVIFLIGSIFYLHWKFALITICILPLAMVPIAVLGSKMRKSGKQIAVRMADLFLSIQEGITGNAITKIYSKEQQEISRFQRENENYYATTMRWVRADVLGAPIMEFIGSIAAVFLLWYGGRDVINGAWSTGSFFSFLGASISAYKPIKEFTGVNSRIQQGLACAERIFEILDEKPSVQETPGAQTLPPFKSTIEYVDISFAYEAERKVLDGMNLSIRAGEVVAIVGPSGSGKTTLTQLLPRLFDAQQGKILIDGVEIKAVTLESLRRQIAMVTQDTFLFNESVRYNIAYGRSYALEETSQADIEQAARIANAHDFILQMPQGYDTVIGERGVRLSGGQRQRLSIARAVLKNPPILILDEATSALDNESERLVQEALERLMNQRTVLVVAHRLSTVRKADRIIVLEKGQIVEDGRHQALLDKSGLYRRLYDTEIAAHP